MRLSRQLTLVLLLFGFISASAVLVVTVGAPIIGIDFALDRGGTITGTVTDGMVPLQNIDVEIYNAAGALVATATTNAMGVYTASGLLTGNHFAVTSNFLNFNDVLYDAIPCPGGACNPTNGTPIPVTVGMITSNIDFMLTLAGGISGTVTNSLTMAPISPLTIYIFDPAGNFVDLDTTDAMGFFSVPGLPAGTYFAGTDNFLPFEDQLYMGLPCVNGVFGGGCVVTTGTPIVVVDGATTGGIDFALAPLPGGSVSGTVSDAGENPLAFFRVEAYDAVTGVFLGSDDSDGNGAYTIPNLPPGLVVIVTDEGGLYSDQLYLGMPCPGGPGVGCNVTDGTSVLVVDQMDTPGIDFFLDLAPAGSVSGTVTDVQGNPLPFFRVEAYDPVTLAFLGSDDTDGAGNYAITNLPPGNVVIVTDEGGLYIDELYNGPQLPGLPCPGGPFNGCNPANGAPVLVVDQMDTPGINFMLDLAPAGSISGRVTDGPGNGLAFYRVRLFDANGGSVTSVFTDANGDYSFPNVAPGSYFVATDQRGLHRDELFDDRGCQGGPFGGGCVVTTGDPVVVVDQVDTGGTDFVLDLAPAGSLSGTVTNLVGAPLAGIRVDAYDAAGIFRGNAFTAANGTYQIGGLTPGNHFVRTNTFSVLNLLYSGIPCFAGCVVTSGAPVPVVNGADTPNINFALDAKASISGKVTDSGNGLPISGVRMRLYNSVGGFVADAFTNGAGDYTFFNVLPGTYYVASVGAVGYLDELHANRPCEGGCVVTAGTPIVVAGAGGGSGDCNGDGAKNAADLTAVLLSQGGPTPSPCDVNGDGTINVLDVLVLAPLLFSGQP